MNEIKLFGKITSPIVMKNTSKGQLQTNFDLFIRRKNNYGFDYIPVVCYYALAQLIYETCQTGQVLYLVGELRTYREDNRCNLVVVARHVCRPSKELILTKDEERYSYFNASDRNNTEEDLKEYLCDLDNLSDLEYVRKLLSGE